MENFIVLISILLLPIFCVGQIQTIFYHEPYRLTLTYDQEWYFQNMNDIGDQYLYGDYSWQNDTLILESSMENKPIMILSQHEAITVIRSKESLFDLKYSDMPSFLFRQRDYHENGQLKSILIDMTKFKKRNNRYTYELAHFNQLGEFVELEKRKVN